MNKLIILICCLVVVQCCKAQTISLEEYLAIVKKYHPLAKQAAIDVEIAKAQITSARSGFDPLFQNEINRKELGGLLYYDQQITELKIPTWYGVDVVAGIESLTGYRTSTPDTKGNSSYIGFSMPLSKNLFMDKRRAVLQQAKAFRSLSVQEQQNMLNDLLYDAAKVYFDWWQQYQLNNLFKQAISNAQQRLKLVKTAFQLGDKPAIDTLEALVQLQSFQIMQNEIALDATNAQLEAGIFMWQQNGEAYQMPQSIKPQEAFVAFADMQIENLSAQAQRHPSLQTYRYKLEALQIDKRLKFQSLLPAVSLKYNQLNQSHNVFKNFNNSVLTNSFRYGVSVAIPLRLSEGRGDYKQAKLKIEQTQLEQLLKQQTINIKLQQQYNQWKNLQQQIALQQAAVSSYQKLQRGEEAKFFNGESSLFLINAREIKTLEAQQKLIDLQSKTLKAAAATLWAAGVLVNERR